MSKSQPASLGGVRAHDDPSRGIMLMIATLIVFSICDGLTKYLATRYSPVQVIWLRYVVYFVLLMPAIVMEVRRRRLWANRAWLQVMRGVLLVMSSICAVYALGRLALADFTAIGF